MRPFPIFAVLLGLAGLIPFVACSLGALAYTDEWSTRLLLALSAYAAIILGFLGGVHWGIAIQAGDGQTVRAQRLRYAGGVLPSLIGWAGLLVTFIGLPPAGLAITAAGFIATTVAEARATRAGLLPRPYMALRWVLSVGVIVCLVSVVIVLLFGGHIVL